MVQQAREVARRSPARVIEALRRIAEGKVSYKDLQAWIGRDGPAKLEALGLVYKGGSAGMRLAVPLKRVTLDQIELVAHQRTNQMVGIPSEYVGAYAEAHAAFLAVLKTHKLAPTASNQKKKGNGKNGSYDRHDNRASPPRQARGGDGSDRV